MSEIVLVTGATTELGQALCNELIFHDVQLALTDLDAKCLTGLAQRLGPRAHALPLDRRDPSELTGLAFRLEQRFGRLDSLIQVTDIIRPEDFADRPSRNAFNALHVDLIPLQLLTRLMIPLLHRSTRARVFMALTTGDGVLPPRRSLCWPELSEALHLFAEELETNTITFHSILPSALRIPTPGEGAEEDVIDNAQCVSAVEQIIRMIETPRLQQPRECWQRKLAIAARQFSQMLSRRTRHNSQRNS